MVSKIFSGSLLVAGTAIGAGMLALPVATCLGGFFPSCIIYLICWLFMAATGLLMLEICLWMPQNSNLVSMASALLGRSGKGASWILYLFLFYCLTIAYVAGGGGFIVAAFGNHIPTWAGGIIFTALFSPFVYAGTKAVDRANLILMAGLILSYLFFIIMGSDHVQFDLLKGGHWGKALLAMPVIFTSFSYQGIIPSLVGYFQKNATLARRAIIIGTAIPFVIYVIWQFLILGIVPVEGAEGLYQAKLKGYSAVYPLKYFLKSSFIYGIGQAFAFFALTTSFLGVTLGLLDFLADGLKIEKTNRKKKNLLFGLVFIPPVAVVLANPGIFIAALTIAGGIGCALLLGLMPIIMVWVGRYHKKYPSSTCQLPGGRGLLILLGTFLMLELVIEFLNEF